MAFLCPSRKGRQRKKKKEPKTPFLGRITGSASVDTLVRVGLEKQHGLSPDSRMRVVQDFMGTIEDELSAQTGDIVYMLYRENDWVYVITEQGQEGFVPFMCVTPCNDAKTTSKRGSSSVKHKKQTNNDLDAGTTDDSMQAEEGSDISSASHSHSSLILTKSNPIPKPARTFNIPDVISANGHVDRVVSPVNGQTPLNGSHNLAFKSSHTSLSDPVTEVRTFNKKPLGKLWCPFLSMLRMKMTWP